MNAPPVRTRIVRWVAALVVLLTVGGCAGIPTSGPVERVDDETGFGESTVEYTPAGPAPGASAVQIVRGFLDAMLAYPVTHRVAAQYLTPGAAADWRPASRTTVYRTATSVVTDTNARVVLAVDARLDPQGRLGRVDRTEQLDLQLARVDGQWRIATAPEGVFVNEDWFDDYVRPFDLYFLDDSGQRLVPVPVHEVLGDQLATSLMTSLAAGPKEGDPAGLRTAVPEVSELRASVPVVGGVAEVEFSTRVGALSADAQRRLSAQIAWTLRQVPSVTEFQVTGGGTVVAPTGETIQDAGGWPSFGPDKSRRWLLAVTDAGVRQVDQPEVEAVRGPWGDDAQGATMVAVGGDLVAAVWADRARVTDARGERPVEIDGADFLRPLIDRHGRAWFVDRSGVRVRVTDGTTVRRFTVPSLSGATSFSLSPDGARYAATVAGVVVVGGIDRRDHDVVALSPPTPVVVDAAARQVTWIDGSRLVFLGPPGTPVQSVRIDGTDAVAAGPGGGQLVPEVTPQALVSPAAANGDLYLLDDTGGLWYLDRSRWVKVDVPTVRGIA